jgi:uncharacterized DUF497 family protein
VSGGVPPGFQWDEDKNQANIAKHGIDFRDAARVFEMPMLDRVDDRKNYVEVRVNSPGVLAGRIIANVTHTDRDGQISAKLIWSSSLHGAGAAAAALGDDPGMIGARDISRHAGLRYLHLRSARRLVARPERVRGGLSGPG